MGPEHSTSGSGPAGLRHSQMVLSEKMWRWVDADVLAILVCTIWALGMIWTATITHWIPGIGDEFTFFEWAHDWYFNGLDRLFDQDGVYNIFPRMNTAYTMAVMKIFGPDHFGWRMSGVVSLFAAGVGVWCIARMLWGSNAAAIALTAFLCNHYTLKFSLIGYNNQDALPVTVWAVFFALKGWWFAAGLTLAACLYVHQAAWLAFPLVALIVAIRVPVTAWWRVWPMTVGFGALAWPTLPQLPIDHIHTMTVSGYGEWVTGPRLARLHWAFVHNIRAWFVDANPGHNIRGSLADPVTMVLAVVGALALHQRCCNRIGGRDVLLPLLWLLGAFIMTGLISPHPSINVTRMYAMMPPLALLAGIGGAFVLQWVPARFRNASGILLLLLIGYWNLARLI